MSAQNVDSNFKFNWNLEFDYPKVKNNLKVFSTFACGGGSTMGYKLAGFDVIGANDIDPKIAKVYIKNHKPKHFFLCPIKDLLKKDLPKEFYSLDILDGSPPCSTFSTNGQREKNWGKEKKFKEGQAKQVLDDLFFDFIALTEKLKPKVVIAENVKGMIIGKAKGYCKLIKQGFEKINYNVQLFLLNSNSMGVPQSRERIFFVCFRKDLNFEKLKLNFNYKPIPFSVVSDENDKETRITELTKKYWLSAKQGDSVGKFESRKKLDLNSPAPTIVASNRNYHPKYMRELNRRETCLIGTFPLDYDFSKLNDNYLIGMSVPPVMIAELAKQIYLQWFFKT